MKALLLVLLTAPLLAFASPAPKQTVMRMEPWWPVNCQKHDYPIVNQVSAIEKISESKTQVTFGFRTVVGSCNDGQFETGVISAQAVTKTERDKIILFKKIVPVISETTLISPDIAMIRVTFDKTSIFKKKDSAKFLLAFYPNGYITPYFRTDAWGRSYMYPSPSIRFMWKVEVARVNAKQSIMRVLLN